jgi:hypothetical protein
MTERLRLYGTAVSQDRRCARVRPARTSGSPVSANRGTQARLCLMVIPRNVEGPTDQLMQICESADMAMPPTCAGVRHRHECVSHSGKSPKESRVRRSGNRGQLLHRKRPASQMTSNEREPCAVMLAAFLRCVPTLLSTLSRRGTFNPNAGAPSVASRTLRSTALSPSANRHDDAKCMIDQRSNALSRRAATPPALPMSDYHVAAYDGEVPTAFSAPRPKSPQPRISQ